VETEDKPHICRRPSRKRTAGSHLSKLRRWNSVEWTQHSHSLERQEEKESFFKDSHVHKISSASHSGTISAEKTKHVGSSSPSSTKSGNETSDSSSAHELSKQDSVILNPSYIKKEHELQCHFRQPLTSRSNTTTGSSLICGRCLAVFDASKGLSVTMADSGTQTAGTSYCKRYDLMTQKMVTNTPPCTLPLEGFSNQTEFYYDGQQVPFHCQQLLQSSQDEATKNSEDGTMGQVKKKSDCSSFANFVEDSPSSDKPTPLVSLQTQIRATRSNLAFSAPFPADPQLTQGDKKSAQSTTTTNMDKSATGIKDQLTRPCVSIEEPIVTPTGRNKSSTLPNIDSKNIVAIRTAEKRRRFFAKKQTNSAPDTYEAATLFNATQGVINTTSESFRCNISFGFILHN